MFVFGETTDPVRTLLLQAVLDSDKDSDGLVISMPPQSYREKGVMADCCSHKAGGAGFHTSQIATSHHPTCASRDMIG